VLLALACRDKADSERRRALNRLRDVRSAQRIAAIRELAPGADRETASAIARAAEDAPADVRREVAIALGKSAAPEAVDLLGALLRDPSDRTRAAAAEALASKPAEKTKGYIFSAWELGGPATRAAIARSGGALLQGAVEAETRARTAALRRRLDDKRVPVRSAALRELGTAGTAEAVAELSARLVDDNPAVAAGAAQGLGDSGSAEAVALLARALASGRPLVAPAAALALGRLATPEAAQALVTALATASDGLAGVILEAFGPTPPPEPALPAVCRLAREAFDPGIALRAWRLAAKGCVPQLVVAASDDRSLAARLLVAADAGARSEPLLARAREALDDPDARAAAAAAAYVAVAGAKADADRLQALMTREFESLISGRLELARRTHASRLAIADRDPGEHLRRMGEQFGVDAGPPPPLSPLDKLLLRRRADPERVEAFEPRLGSIDLIATAATGAAKLGADAAALAARLLDDDDTRLRQAAVVLASMAGEAGEPVRRQLRSDEEPAVAVAVAVQDLADGAPQAVERAVGLLQRTGEPAQRQDLFAALGRTAETAQSARAALTMAAMRSDPAAAEAVGALARLDGPDVLAALRARLEDVHAMGAAEAVAILAARESPESTSLLAWVATHPKGAVRATALRALATRKACGSAPTAAALRSDFEGTVRVAAQGLVEACAGAPGAGSR